jgi:hypothetical protein
MEGNFGVWTGLRQWPRDPGELAAAAEVEHLGFSAVWIGGSAGQFPIAVAILAATEKLVVATGVVQIWANPAAEVAASHHQLSVAYPGRFLLGLGVGHAPVEAAGQTYERPLQKMGSYLDELDLASDPVPRSERVLAALRPRAMTLAATRSAGAHPYNVPPEHTATARAQQPCWYRNTRCSSATTRRRPEKQPEGLSPSTSGYRTTSTTFGSSGSMTRISLTGKRPLPRHPRRLGPRRRHSGQVARAFGCRSFPGGHPGSERNRAAGSSPRRMASRRSSPGQLNSASASRRAEVATTASWRSSVTREPDGTSAMSSSSCT